MKRIGKERQVQDLPTVSVVIPVFNRRKRALAAAASALDQTMPPLEVIIVDDGSTDGIEESDFTAIDSRIRLIRLRGNMGGGAARNAGMDAARADWVALLDSDDLWVPDKLERQFARITQEQTRPEIVAGANVLVRTPGQADRPSNRRPPPPGIRLSEYFLVYHSMFQTSTLLLPTGLAREVRFDERLRRHQDWDFLLRLEKRGAQFSYIHEPLAIWDNAPDPDRVSISLDCAPTLAWYEMAGDAITPKARHVHYMRRHFANHFRQDKMAALKTLGAFTFAYPLGPLYLSHLVGHTFNAAGRRLRRLTRCA